MSRRTYLPGMVSVLFLAASALGLAAQEDSSERERQIVEQLDRLQVHYQEVKAADRTLDSIWRVEAAMAFQLDTAFVGSFLVASPPDQLDEAVEVFSGAWEQFDEILSGWVPPEGERRPILRYIRTREAVPGNNARDVFLRPWHPRAYAESRALAVMEIRIFETAMPRGLRMWAPELGLMNRETLEFAYRNLIITAAESSRDCFEGDSDRCWDALGLRNVETSWESWYDADERREWVLRSAFGNGPRLEGICDQGPSDCLSFIRSRRKDAPIPAQPFTRASFLGHALRVGGEGALVRLNAGDETTSLADRLIAASGLSADGLVESWRQEVLAAAPPAQTGLSLKLLSGALLWSLVFSGFSMRSTRWRA